MQKRRVLVIGLDGATFTILQPLIDRGRLPNLAEMQRQGSWGTLLSTLPPVTAPAWSSFMTGVNPARHGIVGFFRRDPTGYAHEETAGFVHADHIPQPTLWDILSQAGKRVGVINVPLTYPPHPVNGIMITGMLTPPSATRFTFPPELAKHLERYQIDLDYTRGETGFGLVDTPDPNALIQAVTQMLERREKNCLRLIADEEWDFFAVVFVGTDRLFHELWHYLDPSHPAYGSTRGNVLRRSVEDYLVRLDAVVGNLMRAAGRQVTTVVMSDHGFGPAPVKRANLNDWLREQGLLHLARGATDWHKPEFWATRLGLRRAGIKRALERLIPLRLLRQAGTDKQGRRELAADWNQTRAHVVQMYNHYAGIDINVKGRKRQGNVEPGPEYEQLRDRILSGLAKLRDADNGVALVQGAWRREDIFEGEHIDQVPDIVIELNPQYAGLAPLGNGSIVTSHNPRRQGDHRRDGIFLAHGPDIARGALSSPPDITCLAPTILYMLGVAVPGYMDGRVLTDVFQADYVAAHPIQYDDAAATSRVGGNHVHLDQGMEEISERLQALGYVD